MTTEQKAVAEAYSAIPSDAFTAIFADLKDFARAGVDGGAQEKAGAWQVLGHILHRRDELRREKARGPKQPAKGRLKSA